MDVHLILALMVGVGLFLAVDALFPRTARVRLMDEDSRPLSMRAIAMFFEPAAERVASIGRGDVGKIKMTLAARLARANYPPPFTSPEAVLAYQLFTAVLFATMGIVFTLLVGLGGVGGVIAAGMAIVGWIVPPQTIANAERTRREQLTIDAGSTLDRLASYVAAGNTLDMAVTQVAKSPGGEWVAELRKVAAAYAVGKPFLEALDNLGELNGRLPEIVRVTDRLRAAFEMGGGREGGVAASLRQMARDARLNIEMVIRERGERNRVFMVIPAFFALLAVAVILMAPGMIRMLEILG